MIRIIRNVVFCLLLGLASLHNVKMKPEEVEALLRAMNEPKVAHTLPMESPSGDDPPMGLDHWPPRIWGSVVSDLEEE